MTHGLFALANIRLATVLKLLLVLAILVWLLHSGQLDMARLKSVRAGPILAALVGFRVLAAVLPVIRWHLVVRGQGLAFPFWQAVHVGLIGTFFNAVTPATLGQDTARLFYGRKLSIGSNAALVGSILTDRFIGLAALAVLGIVFGGWYQWNSGIAMSRWLAIAPLVFLGGLALCAGVAIGGMSALRGRLFAPARRVLAAVTDSSRRPGLLTVAFLLSVAGHMAVIGGFYCAFVILGGSPPLLAVLAISPVITLLRGIPLTPMGLGLMEWASELLYSMADQSDGAEVVMLTRIVTVLFGLSCGVLLFIPMKLRAPNETQ